jgi:hypothetical protein
VVCLGGDGVILHASSLFKQHIPPVVSFHLGSMGFLTNHPYPDFRQELRQVRRCNMLLYDLNVASPVPATARRALHRTVFLWLQAAASSLQTYIYALGAFASMQL